MDACDKKKTIGLFRSFPSTRSRHLVFTAIHKSSFAGLLATCLCIALLMINLLGLTFFALSKACNPEEATV